ncbi:pilus assembly protein [Sphingomonas parva]|nr:pilus assembly protein [Sphingomonas parva]
MALARRRLSSFKNNERGNALPLMAAAVFPIFASIGAGVDIARAHMTEAKLQEAVDSAALAGRRAMSGNDIATARSDAQAYLGFNFPAGYNGTTPVISTVTSPSTGTVRVTAETRMPTTFMKLFGYDEQKISVSSEATQNFENIDIVLVLDTTGSMDENAGNNKTRIQALRAAVREFYKELEPSQTALANQGLRMRFGIVPYSTSVNVGKLLRSKSTSYIQSSGLEYYQWRDTDSRANRESWSFGKQTRDFSSYLNNTPLSSINGHNYGVGKRWTGCIEERKTIATITATDQRAGPPSGALDLNIDLIPTSDTNTKWKPYFLDPKNAYKVVNNQIVWTQDPNQGCPTQATPLGTMNATSIGTAVDALVPDGNTYLDIGMIWGTRMISSGGVFGIDNPATWRDRPVRKYIIFMTDGYMNTPRDMCFDRNCTTDYDHTMAYSAYGIERFDARVGGTSDNDNRERHLKRFLMACNEARARQISVWTIAFAEGDTDELKACASNADQFAFAADTNALIAKFKEIGKNIGPLRLSK